MKFISELVMVIVAPYFLRFIAGRNKLQTLNFLIYTIFVLEIVNILKQIYGDPRPYMVFKSITPLGHDYECGFPSGHSTFFMYIISFIFEEFILKRKLFINQSNLSILT